MSSLSECEGSYERGKQNMSKRVFLIVLDSVGVGELPDAAEFGDEGSNTVKAAASSGLLNMPNMKKLGFFNILGIDDMYDEETADEIIIQYGGSVKPANASEIMNQDEIDGALVGGASLKAADFMQIIDF